MPSLSDGVLARIDRLFAPHERAAAAALLSERCSADIPGVWNSNATEIERIQIAALKLSGGDTSELMRAVEIAHHDWRDVLVAAGFGRDVHAHESWWP